MKTGPRVRPLSSRGSSRAAPASQNTVSSTKSSRPLAAAAGLGLGALGLHLSAAPGQVQVLDVEAEDLLRPRARLVEHPPQRLLAQVDLPSGDQPVDSHLGAGRGVGVGAGARFTQAGTTGPS
jgi:hypothetical protein